MEHWLYEIYKYALGEYNVYMVRTEGLYWQLCGQHKLKGSRPFVIVHLDLP